MSRYIILITGLLLLPVLQLTAQDSPKRPAIGGYDPVSYHLEDEAQKGSPEYALEWDGRIWHFISAEHRDIFRKEPEKYAPRFGGQCANGLSEGHGVSGNPEIWRIHDGELYLFFSRSGRNRWDGNREGKITIAEMFLEAQE